MSNQELQEQYQRCKQWQDPEQWECLALAYYARGYALNALHCFRQADSCRTVTVVTAEVVQA